MHDAMESEMYCSITYYYMYMWFISYNDPTAVSFPPISIQSLLSLGLAPHPATAVGASYICRNDYRLAYMYIMYQYRYRSSYLYMYVRRAGTGTGTGERAGHGA